MLRNRSLTGCCGCLLAIVLGCSKPGMTIVPVRGTVTLDGEILQPQGGFGRVIFYPNISAHDLLQKGDANNQEAGRVGVGDIKPDGTYSVSTYTTGDGLAIGSYTASVVLLQDLPAVPVRAKKSRDGGLPKKYTKAETSGFTIDVKPTDSVLTFDLDLKSNGS